MQHELSFLFSNAPSRIFNCLLCFYVFQRPPPLAIQLQHLLVELHDGRSVGNGHITDVVFLEHPVHHSFLLRTEGGGGLVKNGQHWSVIDEAHQAQPLLFS